MRKPARKIAYVLTIHCPWLALICSSVSIEGSAIETIEKSTSSMKKVALSNVNATQFRVPVAVAGATVKAKISL